MYSRLLSSLFQAKKSFFLFGPRGTGKTAWAKKYTPGALYIDLLNHNTWLQLSRQPAMLESFLPQGDSPWVVIDEIQRVPALLNAIHRLIETDGYRFVMIGSSMRKLRRGGANLLAGRAHIYYMHPLTAQELGEEFQLKKALQYGLLPAVIQETAPEKYLQSYIFSYLKEEVMLEGLARNLSAFNRFLEIASFSQAQVLNMHAVSRESQINARTVLNYFDLLYDLLLAYRIPPFTKRAKRRLVHHPKFFFFDVGVFNMLRPKGPFDRPEEIEGAALETLFLQSAIAINDLYGLKYTIYYWRTQSGLEVDFVLYGEKGIQAFEIKRSKQVTKKDCKGLFAFLKAYPTSKAYLLYGGEQQLFFDKIQVLPFENVLRQLPSILQSSNTSSSKATAL